MYYLTRKYTGGVLSILYMDGRSELVKIILPSKIKIF